MSSKLNIFRSRYATDIIRPKSQSRFSIGTFSLGTLLLISNIISYCRISLLWKFSQISPGNCIRSLSKFNNHSNYKFRKMHRVLFNIYRTKTTQSKIVKKIYHSLRSFLEAPGIEKYAREKICHDILQLQAYLRTILKYFERKSVGSFYPETILQFRYAVPLKCHAIYHLHH